MQSPLWNGKFRTRGNVKKKKKTWKARLDELRENLQHGESSAQQLSHGPIFRVLVTRVKRLRKNTSRGTQSGHLG
jgi:hypothetical protein